MTIPVLSLIATALKRKDEVPNIELANAIADKNDKEAVMVLVENLSNKSKDIQHDCIKVLYELGALKPELISGYSAQFLGLLKSKNNRMQWGGMYALSCIALEVPSSIYAVLPAILDAADAGSVITKDGAVAILVKLCSLAKYKDYCFPLLLEQLANSATNQLPMYAENALPVVNGKNKQEFIRTLTSRLDEIEKETKKARAQKVIKKAEKIK